MSENTHGKDLVDSLKEPVLEDPVALCAEAAAEIECLRAQNRLHESVLADLRKWVKSLGTDMDSAHGLDITTVLGAKMERLRASEALAVAERDRTCTWTDEVDGPWQTACGHAFEFISEGPGENGFKHCCFCGGKIIVKEASDAH